MYSKQIIFVTLAVALLLFGCAAPAEGTGKMKVVVTLLPQAEFAEEMVGDKADVIVMVPPGASPHSYEPAPSQLEEVAGASLYFKVGSGVEFERAWMEDIQGVNPNLKIIDTSHGIALIEMEEHEHHEHEEHEGEEEHEHEEEHVHTGLDPHIWNSPKNAKVMVENMYEALAGEDPDNAEYYRANADAYISRLDQLDSSISNTLEGSEDREFIVFHPAWGYFARDYGLEQVAIEEAGKEPTAQSLQHVVDTAKEHRIKVVFASPQFSTSSAETVASEIGGQVVLIDPLGKNYLENMQNVSDAFAAARDAAN
ncbi:zinc ABC transporter substrate-binding protein [Candidatus Micrarchaeota archaeon]|nr:zinc ABC transporter substrate-binding protein [Candidatus Micrarchaeota archaeon]MBD3417823.1 zinc ABC transporter substrate-binding protein [Candidatus Micrarchaeota archaeon]